MTAEGLCQSPNHRDQMSWGHPCPSAPWGWGQKQPYPETDDGLLWPYRRSAIGLIRVFDLGDLEDEGLIDEVSQEIAEAILDLGTQLKRERRAARATIKP
jgi:hypothetical protein